MSSNYVIDFSITFDNGDNLDMFRRTCDDVPKTVGQNLEMDIDEVRVDPDPVSDRIQITGTSDVIPGRKAFRRLFELPGCLGVEMWYSGGDRDIGVVVWDVDTPDSVDHVYLPSNYKPEKDDMESLYAAHAKHTARETLNVNDLWGYYAEENR